MMLISWLPSVGSSLIIFPEAKRVDPDQAALRRAAWSGSALFEKVFKGVSMRERVNPLLHTSAFGRLWNVRYLKKLWKNGTFAPEEQYYERTFAPEEQYYEKWNICSWRAILWKMEYLLLRSNIIKNGANGGPLSPILWKMEHLLLRSNIMKNGAFAPEEQYYEKGNICSWRANVPFSIIFS